MEFESRNLQKNVLLSSASGHVLGPTQPPFQWVPISFLGVKLSGRDVRHNLHVELRLTMHGAIPPTDIRLRSMGRDNFTVTIILSLDITLLQLLTASLYKPSIEE